MPADEGSDRCHVAAQVKKSNVTGGDTAPGTHQEHVSCAERCFDDCSMAQLEGQPVRSAQKFVGSIFSG